MLVTRPQLIDVPVAPIADVDAERLLIAGCMTNGALADELLLPLPPAAITDSTLSTIAGAIRRLRGQGAPIDAAGIWRDMRRQGSGVALDTLTALARLDAGTALTRYHAQAVRTCYTLQRVVALSGTLASAAYQPGADAMQVLASARGELDRLIEGAATAESGVISLAESARQVWQAIRSGAAPGIPTGYRDLDGVTGGWHAGELSLLAARPGHGKSALALNMAEQVAAQGVPVFVSSLEMSHDQLTKRMLAGASGVDGQAIRLHAVPDHAMPAVAEGVKKLARLPIDLYDRAGLTTAHLRARVQAWRAGISGPAFVIVDYLQLMRGSERYDSRVQEIGEISGMLKALARDLHVPVLALSQLNRAVEGRASHIPLLSDLRESGNLEQDADNVFFIYREEMFDPDTDKKGIAELHIAKQRSGPVGAIPLRYDALTTTFKTLTFRSPDGY